MTYETMHETTRDGMVTLYQVYKTKDETSTTGFWYYRFRFNKKTIRKSTKTKVLHDAYKVAADAFDEAKYRLQLNVPEQNRTFKSCFAEWTTSQEKFMSWDRKRYFETTNRLHFNPIFGELKVSEIFAGTITDYWNYRKSNEKVPSPATLRMEAQGLRQFLNWCLEMRYINHIPKIKSPDVMRSRDNRRPAFSTVDYATILTKGRSYICEEPEGSLERRRRVILVTFVAVCCLTGLRVGEARHIKNKHLRADIDEDVFIDLPESRMVNGEQRRFKTGKRTVHCMPNIKPWLKLRRSELPDCNNPEDYLFPNDKGSTVKLTTHFRKYMIYCGTELSPDDKPYTSYSCRHTYATQRIMRGVGLMFLADQMGTSIKMLENHYSHLETDTTKMELRKGYISNEDIMKKVFSEGS